MSGGEKVRPREIFLSHATKDDSFAVWLKDELRQCGISVWYSESHIEGASQWHDEIGKALQRCDWFLVVLSPDAIQSIWVKRELLFALEQPRLVGRIVPVVLSHANFEQLSWTLSGMQHVDFSAARLEGLRQLIRIWGMKE